MFLEKTRVRQVRREAQDNTAGKREAGRAPEADRSVRTAGEEDPEEAGREGRREREEEHVPRGLAERVRATEAQTGEGGAVLHVQRRPRRHHPVRRTVNNG